MIVSGILRDLTGASIPKGLIQIVATVTSEQVIAGSSAHIQCDHDGAYRFTLLNGSYKIYAQPSRCSDIAYQGETVITSDTADGDLNTIIGITTPVLPPQVEQAINAANQSAQSALQAKSEKERVLAIAVTIDDQADQVAVNTAQAAGFAQTASNNASGANNAKNAAVTAKDDAVKQVDIANEHQTATAQLKQDVVLLKSQTETFSNNASSSAQIANTAKVSAVESAENAAAECQQAFKAASQAQAHSETASDHADRAEQALSATDGALESVTDEANKAKSYALDAEQQATISAQAKESSVKAQINSNTAAAASMRAEVVVDQALDKIVKIGKLATESIEQTANNALGADLAAKDAAKANQQAQAVVSVVNEHANEAGNAASTSKECLAQSQRIKQSVTEISQQSASHEANAKKHSVSSADSNNSSKKAAQLSQRYSESSIAAGKQAQTDAGKAEQANEQSQQAAQLAMNAVDATKLAVVGVAKDLIITQNIIISFHPIS